MLTQYILTALIVALAVAYAAWRIWKRFRHDGSCQGCALADCCNKRGGSGKNRQARERHRRCSGTTAK